MLANIQKSSIYMNKITFDTIGIFWECVGGIIFFGIFKFLIDMNF